MGNSGQEFGERIHNLLTSKNSLCIASDLNQNFLGNPVNKDLNPGSSFEPRAVLPKKENEQKKIRP